MFMELGTDGHLFDALRENKTFSEETTSIVTREIVQGVKHMHSKGIIHRDIKMENIVFTCVRDDLF
jgi:serine/threonine protein kinase